MDFTLGLPNLQAVYGASPASPGPHITVDPGQGPITLRDAGTPQAIVRMESGAGVLAHEFRTVSVALGVDVVDIFAGSLTGVNLTPALFPGRPTVNFNLDTIKFLNADRVFTVVPGGGGMFDITSVYTLNFVNSTLGAFVRFAPTIQYQQDSNPFGQGLLFNAIGTFENLPSVAANMTTGLSFVGQSTFRANAQTITMIQLLDFVSQPRLTVTAGGTFTMTQDLRHYTARGTITAGATLTGDRICFNAGALSTFTGTLTGVNVGFQVDNLVSGVGGAVGFRSTMSSGALRFFIEHTGSAASLFGGDVEIDGALNHDGSTWGMFATAPTTQQTVVGSRAGNAALASLLTGLAAYGVVIDGSTA